MSQNPRCLPSGFSLQYISQYRHRASTHFLPFLLLAMAPTTRPATIPPGRNKMIIMPTLLALRSCGLSTTHKAVIATVASTPNMPHSSLFSEYPNCRNGVRSWRLTTQRPGARGDAMSPFAEVHVRHFSIVLQVVEFPDMRAHRVVADETSASLKSR
jgi:hypothetical protein